MGVVVTLATLVSAASAASSPSELGLSICPAVTETTYPAGGAGPSNGCGPAVFSAGSVLVERDNTCTAPTNTDLGTFLTSQNPLGAFVGVHGPNSCATSPPTLGPGVGEGGVLDLSAAQAGFCPTTMTVQARTGPFGSVVFPIGSLPFGSYRVTVDFPDQTVADPRFSPTSWIGNRASGTLHVGTTFTETDTGLLAGPGRNDTFAALLSSSLAGPGAGRLVATRTANPSVVDVSGTEFYACGTIGIAARITYGKRGRTGVARLTGTGTLTGGTGNYRDVTGTFALTGKYSARTKRGTLVLRGTATFGERPPLYDLR